MSNISTLNYGGGKLLIVNDKVLLMVGRNKTNKNLSSQLLCLQYYLEYNRNLITSNYKEEPNRVMDVKSFAAISDIIGLPYEPSLESLFHTCNN